MILGAEPITQAQVDAQRAANPAPAHSYSIVEWVQGHIPATLMLAGAAAFLFGQRKLGAGTASVGAAIEIWGKLKSRI